MEQIDWIEEARRKASLAWLWEFLQALREGRQVWGLGGQPLGERIRQAGLARRAGKAGRAGKQVTSGTERKAP